MPSRMHTAEKVPWSSSASATRAGHSFSPEATEIPVAPSPFLSLGTPSPLEETAQSGPAGAVDPPVRAQKLLSGGAGKGKLTGRPSAGDERWPNSGLQHSWDQSE